jgi:predicted phosphohydrolase
MRLFAIGDTHLPSMREKTMDRFGWTDHPARLQKAWDETVRADDVVIVAGDISWATKPSEVQGDLQWLNERPGKKVLLRGNHDYWWGDSAAKLARLFEPFGTIQGFIHNTAVQIDGLIIAGSRLWTAPEAPPLPGGEMGGEEVRKDYVQRETRRLQLSIEKAQAAAGSAERPLRRVVAVHFPPLYSNAKPTAFSRIIEAFQPQVCVYGHLHGDGIAAGFVGEHGGVRYVLAACDAAGFRPVLLLEK